MRTLFCLMLLPIVFCLWQYGYRHPIRDQLPFDSQTWKDCDVTTSDARFRMVPTLLEANNLVGRSIADIEALLGTTDFLEVDRSRVAYHYQLGRERTEWGSWGFPFLTVEFIDGTVRRVYHLAGMGAVPMHDPRQP